MVERSIIKAGERRQRKTRKPRTAQEERALTTIPKSKRYTLFFIIIIISVNADYYICNLQQKQQSLFWKGKQQQDASGGLW